MVSDRVAGRHVVKRIGMGLVGAGFVGPHHIDAVRRLGYVDIVAVAGSNDDSGRAKADTLGARRGYGSYQALLEDPEVEVVHNATPNHLHYAVTSAALAKGKHVVSDKPLAMTAAESKKLVEEARRAGVVAAVTFNYRGNPLVQQARHAVARGDISVGQVCGGHKNDLVLEVCGATASMRWRQEHQNELWIGRRDGPNELLQKDPSLL